MLEAVKEFNILKVFKVGSKYSKRKMNERTEKKGLGKEKGRYDLKLIIAVMDYAFDFISKN